MIQPIDIEVKGLGSSDVELDAWTPAGPEEVFFVLEVEIGERRDERADLFYVTVATPEGLRNNHNVPTTRAGPLMISNYSFLGLRREVERIVGSCTATSWDESVERLQEYFDHEYADYISE